MKTQFEELINSDIPVLIDFYADWCQPCQMMKPILEEVKRNMGDRIKIIKIDTDRNPAISQKLEIRSIPTIMLFRDGKTLWRQAGVVPATQLQQMIEQAIKS
jgi:thioredoxin 1